MHGSRRRQSGYTLTEILMAVGILGVGMTMVASVFPVAVDQSRQSRDSTMAALSARSVAASMRACRHEVIEWCRGGGGSGGGGGGGGTPRGGSRGGGNTGGSSTGSGATSGTTIIDTSGLSSYLRAYNPQVFLYEPPSGTSGGGGTGGGGVRGGGSTPDPDPPTTTAKEHREYAPGDQQYGMWAAGGFVPVVFATPIDVNDTNGVTEGPWRITIVVFKARGRAPGSSTDEIPLESFATNPVPPGGYIMDASPGGGGGRQRGEAYKVSLVQQGVVIPAGVPAKMQSGARGGGTGGTWTAYVADGLVQGSNVYSNWVSLPGAVAAYHTVIGD